MIENNIYVKWIVYISIIVMWMTLIWSCAYLYHSIRFKPCWHIILQRDWNTSQENLICISNQILISHILLLTFLCRVKWKPRLLALSYANIDSIIVYNDGVRSLTPCFFFILVQSFILWTSISFFSRELYLNALNRELSPKSFIPKDCYPRAIPQVVSLRKCIHKVSVRLVVFTGHIFI